MQLIEEAQLHPDVIAKLNHSKGAIFDDDLIVNGDIQIQGSDRHIRVNGKSVLFFHEIDESLVIDWYTNTKKGMEMEGGADVSGDFSVSGTKHFVIPHPLKPKTAQLTHAC